MRIQFVHSQVAAGFQLRSVAGGFGDGAPAHTADGRWRLALVLLLSLLVHAVAVREVPFHWDHAGPILSPPRSPLEVTLELPPAEVATPVRRPPSEPIHRARARTHTQTQELSPTFYARLPAGASVERFLHQESRRKRQDALFNAPVSVYNNKAGASGPPAPGSIKTERMDNGALRVIVYDRHGHKHCYDARPKDILNEFDTGGLLQAVVGGC